MSKPNENDEQVVVSRVPKLRFEGFEGDWEEKTIGNVCVCFSGGTPSTKNKEFYKGNIPFIRSAEIDKYKTELFLSEDGLKKSSAKIVKKGDVLVALYGANSGEVALSKINGAINQAILCLKSNQNNAFIYYFLLLIKDYIVNKYIQGGQGNLSGDIIKSIVLLFPSLPEQQKIASCLSSLDDLITAENQKLEALKNHKKGLMQKLFPQDGQTVPELRFEGFEGDWEEKTLENIAFYVNGKAHEQDITDSGKYIVVNSKFISSDGSVRKFTNNAFCLAKKNDILMVLSDVPNGKAIAKCYMVNQENLYTVNQRICKLTPHKVNSTFLLFILNRNDFFLKFDDGVKQTNLRKEDVLNCPLIVPTLPEQQKIATCLSSLDDLITSQTDYINTLKKHKKGLIQQLFPSMDETN